MEIEAAGDNDTLYRSNEIKLKINSGEFQSLQELTFTKEAIAWKTTNDARCFIPWDKVVVQAIQGEPQRSIYLMIDETWQSDESQDPVLPVNNGNGTHHESEGENEEEDEEEEEEEQNITEFWLLPDDIAELENIYYIMTRCGNNVDMEDDGESEDEEFLQGEDMEQMNINDDENERFADAE